jgi:hypothetical protein
MGVNEYSLEARWQLGKHVRTPSANLPQTFRDQRFPLFATTTLQASKQASKQASEQIHCHKVEAAGFLPVDACMGGPGEHLPEVAAGAILASCDPSGAPARKQASKKASKQANATLTYHNRDEKREAK